VGDWLFASCFSMIADLAEKENGQSLSRLVARICGSESANPPTGISRTRAFAATCGGSPARRRRSFPCHFTSEPSRADARPRCAAPCAGLATAWGWAFQIIDDILDFEQAGGETGKPTGSDLSQGIYTLPTILALKRDNGQLAAALFRRPRRKRALSRAALLIESAAASVQHRNLLAGTRKDHCGRSDGCRRTPPAARLKK